LHHDRGSTHIKLPLFPHAYKRRVHFPSTGLPDGLKVFVDMVVALSFHEYLKMVNAPPGHETPDKNWWNPFYTKIQQRTGTPGTPPRLHCPDKKIYLNENMCFPRWILQNYTKTTRKLLPKARFIPSRAHERPFREKCSFVVIPGKRPYTRARSSIFKSLPHIHARSSSIQNYNYIILLLEELSTG
jgi:hypothetical protein